MPTWPLAGRHSPRAAAVSVPVLYRTRTSPEVRRRHARGRSRFANPHWRHPESGPRGAGEAACHPAPAPQNRWLFIDWTHVFPG